MTNERKPGDARERVSVRNDGGAVRSGALDVRAVARALKAAQDGGYQVAPITSQFDGFDLDAAYAVAWLIHEARVGEGAVPAGRKIGFTNSGVWPRLGVDAPMWAYTYDRTVVRLSDGHGTCAIGRFPEPRIEPEIVFHFRAAPPAGADLPAILACIDWVAPGFEIVRSHFPGWSGRPIDIVADAGAHAALLVGEPCAVSRLGADPVAALANFSLTLTCGGEVRATGRGANVLGNPLAAVAGFMAVVAKQPRAAPLQANEIVTTGTITNPQPVRPGDTWHTDIDGLALAGLTVEFVA